jgi:hypothetical protein
MLEDGELLPQSKVVEDEIASAAERQSKGAEEAEKDGSPLVKMLEVGRRGHWLSEGREGRGERSLPLSLRKVS